MPDARNLPRPLLDALVTLANAVAVRSEYGACSSGAIADGTTDGKLKTTATVAYKIAGKLYSKAATDDLWDLSAQTDTVADEYQAFYLYLDASGTATIGAGTIAASAALAIAALPTVPTTKSVIGCYVAGPSTDFNGAAGLDSFGDIHNGWPSIGDAEIITVVNP